MMPELVSQGDDEIFQPLPQLLVNFMLGQVFTFCKTHQHRTGRSSNEILQFFLFCEIDTQMQLNAICTKDGQLKNNICTYLLFMNKKSLKKLHREIGK